MDPQVGFEGQIITTIPHLIRGAKDGLISGEPIRFGAACQIDPTDPDRKRVITASDATAQIAGILPKTDFHAIDEEQFFLEDEDAEPFFGVPKGYPIGLMVQGEVLVYCVAPVVRGSAVAVLDADGAEADQLKGRFTATGTPQVGVQFADSIEAPGLVRVTLYGNTARF